MDSGEVRTGGGNIRQGASSESRIHEVPRSAARGHYGTYPESAPKGKIASEEARISPPSRAASRAEGQAARGRHDEASPPRLLPA